MNYWIISPNVTNNKSEEASWKEAILTNQVAIMGWGEDDKLGRMFIEDVQIGDIILVAQGANWQKKLFLAGQVQTDAEDKQLPNTPRSAWQRKLTGCIQGKELDTLQLDFDGAAYGDTNRIPAIYCLKPLSNNQDKIIADKLIESISKKIEIENMQEIIKLLKYKKQIILQGPPGTGKTKLAKEIAAEIIKGDVTDSPLQKIENFFSMKMPITAEQMETRQRLHNYLDKFYLKFPKHLLKNLTLEEYAFGNRNNNSFCWWLEFGLKELGGYSGQAGKFKIYWKKEKSIYAKYGFIKNVEDNNKAMQMVAEQVSNAANEIDLNTAIEKLGRGYVLKILNTYYPDTYFPVNNEQCLNNILKLLRIENRSFDVFDKTKAIQKYFASKKAQYNADVTNVEFMRFLFDNFDIKGNLSIDENDVITTGEYKIIQFHPSYTYEDFVRGIRVEINGKGLPEYKVVNRILAEFAQDALDNRSANYVLIIDEINRANLTAVLGELIYALEYRYDEKNPSETSVDSMYTLQLEDVDIEQSQKIMLPNNLYIIGTMNTADRSVGHIDYAIRRRFAFVEVLPKSLEGDFETNLFNDISELFVKDQKTMERSEYLSVEFRPQDVWLGHSYFIKKDGVDSKVRLKYEIIPILEEYVKDGVLKETSSKKIDELKNLTSND